MAVGSHGGTLFPVFDRCSVWSIGSFLCGGSLTEAERRGLFGTRSAFAHGRAWQAGFGPRRSSPGMPSGYVSTLAKNHISRKRTDNEHVNGTAGTTIVWGSSTKGRLTRGDDYGFLVEMASHRSGLGILFRLLSFLPLRRRHRLVSPIHRHLITSTRSRDELARYRCIVASRAQSRQTF